MMCSKRETRIIDGAFQEALKSEIHHQHGAVITKSGSSKIIIRGYNQNRSSFLGKKRMCTHAEMDVVQKLIKIYFHRNSMKPDKKFRKYIVWVIRLGMDGKTIKSSIPCDDCLSLLNHLGFKKIGFSDCNGRIQIDTIANLIYKSADYISVAHRYLKIICPYYI